MIGDAINILRTALDHAVYASAICNGHTTPKYRTTSFPFAPDPARLQNAVNGISSVHQDIRTLLQGFQCHPGGNGALWELNNMCNRDKHALIIPMIVGWNTIRFRVDPPKRMLRPNIPFWDSTKNELELFRTPDDNLKYEVSATIDIAFDGSGVLARKPIVPVLRSILNSVHAIVTSIELETQRLFPTWFLESPLESTRNI